MTATALRVLIVDDEPLARARLRALLEAQPGVQVAGEALALPMAWVSWCGIALCFLLRYLAMRLGWNLPRIGLEKSSPGE